MIDSTMGDTTSITGDIYPVFPFYVVLDVSGSMASVMPLVNSQLAGMKDSLLENPQAADVARFSVHTFAAEARVAVPLTDITELEEMPKISAYGRTNYEAAFDLLARALPHDIEWYKQNGFSVYRPAVFFISDGQPSDTQWRAALEKVTSGSYRPNVVAYGMGKQIRNETLAYIANYKAFSCETDAEPGLVIKSILDALIQSVLSSAEQSAAGQPSLVVEPPAGMSEIRIDLV